ncbi:hypothetical protein Tco_0616424 [Tanacetum coccineum]
MYTFSPMMVANSRKHHCRVRSYTREVLVISTNLDIQKNHYPLDFRNRRGDEARIKNTWYNQENVAADHLSRIENDETSDDSDVDDNFPGETLLEITTKDEPCVFLSSLPAIPDFSVHKSSPRGADLHQVEFFEGWKPLLPLQLAVKEVMSE